LEQHYSHSWNLGEKEALELQIRLASQVERNDRLNQVNLVAGVDVAYDERSDRLVAAVVVLNAATLAVEEQAIAEDISRFPYIPGLFSFRELPSIAKAISQLTCTPDLIICDGQGIAHPRRFGLASHIGILFDTPTIGCGKSRLLGAHEKVHEERGALSPLLDGNEIIGCALRTQSKVKPVYISIGHRISLSTACNWILRFSPKYRLPETTRLSDQLVRKTLTEKFNH